MLYICATPIGNLKDVSLRVAETLKEADIILAEDTRVSGKLLRFLDIKAKMLSYHEHNQAKRREHILELLQCGKKLAFVTDAGMPGISDPGCSLIKLCIEHDIAFEILPGSSAVLLGVLYSGFEFSNFYFEGFLPPKSGKRKSRLLKLKDIDSLLVFYEAPHRIVATLGDIEETLGDVDCSVSRELTKLHEETFRGKISACIEKFSKNPPRGEFVITVDNTNRKSDVCVNYKDLIDRLIEEGYDKKDAVRYIALRYGLPKREVYREVNI